MTRRLCFIASVVLAVAVSTSWTQPQTPAVRADSAARGATRPASVPPPSPVSFWGLDVLLSTDGFGIGAFYRHDFTPDVCGFTSFSISEAKDDREFEQYNIYGESYIPGKLNRFLVLPLMFGVQYRLFREDIVDSFRPFVNAAIGPAMVYMMPYADFTVNADGTTSVQQVEYFHALGHGTPHYTGSLYVGFGANFGSDGSSLVGVNFRYYFTYFFGEGLPSMYDPNTLAPSVNKTDFGGFYITFNVGTGVN